MSTAATRIRLHPFPGPAAITSQSYQGRPGCAYHGYCARGGCHVNAKSSTTVSTIPKAQATGRFKIVTEARVNTIEVDKNGRVTGRYDASVSGFDPYPDSNSEHFGDPSGDSLMAPLTSAAVDLTTRKLNWRPDGSYHLLNEAVNRAWDFGRGPAESVSQLRQILALDPKMKLLVGHGLFDLATPYFGSKVILDQLPAYARSDRVKLVVYPGGHMFYSRDATRQAFRAEVEKLMK